MFWNVTIPPSLDSNLHNFTYKKAANDSGLRIFNLEFRNFAPMPHVHTRSAGSRNITLFFSQRCCPLNSSEVDLGNFYNRLFLERRGCQSPKRHSSAYPSIRAFSTTLAAKEVRKNILALIAIFARSARPPAARFAREQAGSLRTSFPFKSKLPSMKRSTPKNNQQSYNAVDSSQ